MDEKYLIKISLITSIIGIVALFFISLGIEPPTVQKLDGIKETEVKIKGEIDSISDQDKIAFLKIKNQKIEITDVILFKDYDVLLKKGDYVEISGTVEDYQGEKEIIGNKVIINK